MANDLSTLEPKLATKLRDAGHAVWAIAENQDLLTWACAQLYPRLARILQETVVLVDSQDQYTITTLSDISRVDQIDPNSTPANLLVQQMMGGTWEFWGNHETIGGTLYINPQFANHSYSLRVHGYAPYALTNATPAVNPPDRYVNLILATAGSEAVRRQITDRAKFKQFDALSQNQNVSSYELTIMLNEMDTEAARLTLSERVWRRPKPALR